MAVIKPATPGFLVTLVATILLAIVVFSVPYLHSIYFLKASLSAEGVSGNLLLGTLGYCMELSNGTTCSKPSVGYELDINALVGNKLPIKIPDIAVKWITYALVLHIVALILSAISALFGLLAHVREMSMTCFSSCIAGFGAVVALIAFIFDLAFFFIAKSRLNSVKGGQASIGIAVWLVLASWLLLFFSGCFYGLGRCCIRRRPQKQYDDQRGPEDGYASQMRLDAMKAEADRKNRQRAGEVGLPAFQEYDPSQPLHAVVDHDEVYVDDGAPYRDNASGPNRPGMGRNDSAPVQNTGYAPGYVQGALGNRAIDEYHSPSNSYPPQPHRQGSGHTQTTSGYAPSQYGYAGPSPPVPENPQYLTSTAYQGHEAYPSQNYGHAQGGTSHYSDISHQQFPSNQYGPYGAPQTDRTGPPFPTYNAPAAPQPQQAYQNPGFNPQVYNNTALLTAAGIASHSTDQYGNPSTSHTPAQQPDRSYTLGGGGYTSGYGENQVPDHTAQQNDNQFFPSPFPTHSESPRQYTTSPAPIQTDVPLTRTNTSPVRGPRGMSSPSHQYSDSPPQYEGGGPSQPTGAWGEKR